MLNRLIFRSNPVQRTVTKKSENEYEDSKYIDCSSGDQTWGYSISRTITYEKEGEYHKFTFGKWSE